MTINDDNYDGFMTIESEQGSQPGAWRSTLMIMNNEVSLLIKARSQ